MKETIDTSKFGIVLVDMQPIFLQDIEKTRRRNLISTQLELLEVCACRDIPVAVLEYSSIGETIYSLREKIKEIPRTRIFKKKYDNGFIYNPKLKNQIKNWGLEHLCITGVNAYACVKETAAGAINHGYNVLTSENLMAGDTGEFGMKIASEWFSLNGTCYTSHQDILKSLK